LYISTAFVSRLQIGLELLFDVGADAQRHVLHLRRRIEKQQPLDQFLGVLHLVDRLLFNVVAELVVTPVVTHLRVQKVLIDSPSAPL
jgi:hypothetical protein